MKCLNWKVVVAAAAVALGLWAVAPGTVGRALPLLALAVCPLSMLLMMRAMGPMRAPQERVGTAPGENILERPDDGAAPPALPPETSHG